MTQMHHPENDPVHDQVNKLANATLGILLARFVMPIMLAIAIPAAGFFLSELYEEIKDGQRNIFFELKDIKSEVNKLVRQNDNHELRIKMLERDR